MSLDLSAACIHFLKMWILTHRQIMWNMTDKFGGRSAPEQGHRIQKYLKQITVNVNWAFKEMLLCANWAFKWIEDKRVELSRFAAIASICAGQWSAWIRKPELGQNWQKGQRLAYNLTDPKKQHDGPNLCDFVWTADTFFCTLHNTVLQAWDYAIFVSP